MTTTTFVAKSSTQSANWDDPTFWSGGVVPNDPGVDVVIPTTTTVSTGQVYASTITASGNHSIDSLSISNNVVAVNPQVLTVVHDVGLTSGGHIQVNAGALLSAGSLTNNQGNISGSGSINAGAVVNNGTIAGDGGLLLTSQTLANNGTISGNTTITVTPGGFSNLAGKTLVGGNYQANAGNTLRLNVGGVIETDAANISLNNGGSIDVFDPVAGAYVPITSSLIEIAPTGTLSLSGTSSVQTVEVDWGPLTVEGSLSIDAAHLTSSPLKISAGGSVTLGTAVIGGPLSGRNAELTSSQLSIDPGGSLRGYGTLSATITNAGTIIASAPDKTVVALLGLLLITGPVSGPGTFEISMERHQVTHEGPGIAELELGAAASGDVIFDDGHGVLILDSPSAFSGTIHPTGSGDTIVLKGISSVAGYSYDGDHNGGTLTIETSIGTLHLNFSGNFLPGDFTVALGPQILATDPTTLTITNTGTAVDATPHLSASLDLGAHPAGWSPAGVGDFNHDGTSDLLWYNSATGDAEIWKLANGNWAGSVDLGSHPAGWTPVGTGDFNHDGTSDVLWYNSATGDAEIWKLANGNWAGSVDIGTHPAGWTPAGIGDFNHDGTSDVLWYNSATNDLEVWKTLNGQWAGSVDIGTHPAGWTPAGVGDFNRDGTADVLWYNATTGDLEVWKTSNGQWTGSVDLGLHPVGWVPAGVGDFNHDGTSDVLWYNSANGDAEVWKVDNGHWAGSVDLGSHPLAWTPAGIGDFNHDGTSDVLWLNKATGHIEVDLFVV